MTSKNNSSKKITVIGAGAWGLSIASLIAENKHLVCIYERSILAAAKVNKYLISKKVPAIATTDFKSSVADAEFIFIVVPSDAVLSVFKLLLKEKIPQKTKVVICSKGLESQGLKLFSQSFEEHFPKNKLVVLSGPNFAGEVRDRLPTITSLASKDSKTSKEVAQILKNNHFSCVLSDDVVLAQIFGAIKNIFAIGCGIIDGLKLGENAKAALITKGSIEAAALASKLGGNPENFISPFGLGDLFLTCSSKKSRNNSLGVLIGSGKKIKEIVNSGQTFEGFKAADLMIKFAKKQKLELPICSSINQILQGNYNSKKIKEIIFKAITK